MRPRLLITAGVLGLPCVVTAQAQTPAPAVAAAPSRYSAAIAEARRFITDTMKALGAPGASITVISKGHVVWSEGFGYADLEQQVPVTPLTRFRVGSVSKSLTSVAVGRLVEGGKLDLDQPIQKYLADYPVKPWPVTSRQLGGHLAGVRHYNGYQENLNTVNYRDVTSSLAIFKNDSLLFEPGARFSYSSYGWNLLSAVLESASSTRFLELMQQTVFDAADMRHTVADHVDSIIPGRARWYTRSGRGGGIVNAGFADNSYKWAGGGFLSTTEDLAHFGDDLLHDRLLKPETVRLLWTSQTTRDGKATGYGIGWFTETDKAGRRRISHSGGSVGGTAFLVIYPDQDLVVAVLVNSDSTFAGATPTIAEMFLKAQGWGT